jgi:hypothetical protein
MKKRISLILAILIILSLSLSSCGIMDAIEREMAIKHFKQPITFLSINYHAPEDTSAKSTSSIMPATAPLPPPTPWDNSLSLNGSIDSGIIDAGEKIKLDFTLRANNSALGKGDLHIVLNKTDDFILEKDGVALENNTYVIPDFFESGLYSDTLSFSLTMSANFEHGVALGCAYLSALFVPDDPQAFVDSMSAQSVFYNFDNILNDGYLPLGNGALNYCADSVETWLSSLRSYGTVFSIMSSYHYEGGLITAEEMLRLCCDLEYNNVVQSYICDYNEDDHSMYIGYYSKNIRYEGSHRITDSRLEEEMREHDDFWITEHYMPAKGGLGITVRILEIMKAEGVITEDEFNREIKLLDEVMAVYVEKRQTFPGLGSKYDEVNALHITHKDK